QCSRGRWPPLLRQPGCQARGLTRGFASPPRGGFAFIEKGLPCSIRHAGGVPIQKSFKSNTFITTRQRCQSNLEKSLPNCPDLEGAACVACKTELLTGRRAARRRHYRRGQDQRVERHVHTGLP